MKTKFSVALNILLVAVLGVTVLYESFKWHGYKAMTCMAMQMAAIKIDSGSPESVSNVLKEVSRAPTYDELVSTIGKLDSIRSAEQAVDGNPH